MRTFLKGPKGLPGFKGKSATTGPQVRRSLRWAVLFVTSIIRVQKESLVRKGIKERKRGRVRMA